MLGIGKALTGRHMIGGRQPRLPPHALLLGLLARLLAVLAVRRSGTCPRRAEWSRWFDWHAWNSQASSDRSSDASPGTAKKCRRSTWRRVQINRQCPARVAFEAAVAPSLFLGVPNPVRVRHRFAGSVRRLVEVYESLMAMENNARNFVTQDGSYKIRLVPVEQCFRNTDDSSIEGR